MPIVLLLAAAQSALPVPTARCSVSDRPVATRRSDLPATVSPALPPNMADPDRPFRAGDAIAKGEEALPDTRLVCGHATDNGYVVEYEIGGRGYSVTRKSFRKTESGYAAE